MYTWVVVIRNSVSIDHWQGQLSGLLHMLTSVHESWQCYSLCDDHRQSDSEMGVWFPGMKGWENAAKSLDRKQMCFHFTGAVKDLKCCQFRWKLVAIQSAEKVSDDSGILIWVSCRCICTRAVVLGYELQPGIQCHLQHLWVENMSRTGSRNKTGLSSVQSHSNCKLCI